MGKGPSAMRSRAGQDGSMDLLCDTLMVEEILPRLHPKCLLRLRAASRRYNALALVPDFAARYWRRAGVLFQLYVCRADLPPRFLPGDDQGSARKSMFGADLSCLPAPSAREKAYLQHVGAPDGAGNVVAVMHSAAGLLLCSRGRMHPVHFYVRNPVTGQWVALPELPWQKWNRNIGEGHGGGLRYAHANSSEFEVWDSDTKEGTIMWNLVHRVGVTELLERNPEAAEFIFDKPSSTITPLGFHPTNDDAVFLGMPKAVAAYSIENGTMSLQCIHDSLTYSYPDSMFPYVHPPYPVSIPAIKI